MVSLLGGSRTSGEEQAPAVVEHGYACE